MRLRLLASVAILGLGIVPTPAPAAVDPTGDPVLFWADQMVQSQTANRVVDSRSIAMVTVALHDAVNVSGGNALPTYLKGLSTSGGDTRAAAAVAAYQVLSTLYPAKATQYATARDQQLAQIPDGAAKSDGVATGTAVGNAVLQLRSSDGSTAVVPYSPTGQVGHWDPNGASFSVPQYSRVTPWLLTSPSEFRPDAPPALDSQQYADAFNEVALLGAANSAARTADQTRAAQFWATTPGNPMLRLAIQLAQGNSLTTVENARLLGLIGVVEADAAIATWDAKLFYDFWRPSTAIQQAGADGNPLTDPISGWQPLIANPPYPGYTSGVAGLMGSDALLLQNFFGNAQNICLTHGTNSALDSCWANFDSLLNEMFMARIWGGIHFRFDMSEGFDLSRNVVANALASPAFAAVPEPGSWLLMLLGFGVVGVAVRRRRAPCPAPA